MAREQSASTVRQFKKPFLILLFALLVVAVVIVVQWNLQSAVGPD